NHEGVTPVLDGSSERRPVALEQHAGDLALFRGRDALHRVTPVEGERTRILVVLAYNNEPGVSLGENARMTFFGRLR
ncbi:MAG: HalD/BesD family halogenase, partial [Ilumatobacteraceae bacterium]